ncbi:putative photosynthetic complex assembly protein PuhE [Sedimentitalea todarodis]|uniref:Photosynthetic complex assembly protein PuhE n=1 Tax=Sedimentitalea todarodis TaxID=1631240 RepID=A0ABU3VKE2_9RHOB|nr:putative photosynthetic complex assembly protein PuhE [Sedimentitalea todarodis]MDU9006648.1 putative photosynthetic complex assembly protein PuhE [Sedimentitalea todarodis]
MTSPWIAALFALFAWWFSTGAILWAVRHADRRGPQARLICTLAGLPVLGIGFWGFAATLHDPGLQAAYLSFLAALAIWGWIELAFLTGAITGPNAYDCPDDTPEWERFIRAWGTIAYHEMLLVSVLVLIWLFGNGAINAFGLWTYTILYFARISAKLNLFYGVPRINTEFIPDALRHLPSHFRISRVNWVFPVSITALSFATACWLLRLYAAQTAGETAGFALLTAITALALLEHWLMVLPLPDAKLWRWMLPAPKQTRKTTQSEVGHHGF